MTFCLMLDVDGVVINGRPQDGLPWATDMHRDLGISPDQLRTAFFAPFWTDIVTGKRPLLDVLEGCLTEIAPFLSARQLVDYWFARDARMNTEILADCDELRRCGVRIFLATNQEHLRASHLMTHLGLGKHVDGMICSAELGARKPHPLFFEMAVRRSGFDPKQTLLVDDTEENVEAARRAGWHAFHWTGDASLLDIVRTIGLR